MLSGSRVLMPAGESDTNVWGSSNGRIQMLCRFNSILCHSCSRPVLRMTSRVQLQYREFKLRIDLTTGLQLLWWIMVTATPYFR
jgi:hypothetical protein